MFGVGCGVRGVGCRVWGAGEGCRVHTAGLLLLSGELDARARPLHRNVLWYRDGLVFEAHGSLHQSA